VALPSLSARRKEPDASPLGKAILGGKELPDVHQVMDMVLRGTFFPERLARSRTL